MERLALLPIENLSADASLDWVSRAAPAIIAAEISGASAVLPLPVDALRDAYAARASQALHGYFSAANGRIEVHAVLEDLERGKIVATLTAEAPTGGGIVGLTDSLARRLSPQVRPFGARNPLAIRSYAEALQASDAATAIEHLRRTLEIDPGFGEAVIALARQALAQGNRDEARDAVDRALQDAGKIDEMNRARLEFLWASINGNGAATATALEKLAGLNPADSELARNMADAMLQGRRFDQAVEWYRKAVHADPSHGLLWNSLAYSQAYAGDLSGARESLQHYEMESPRSPNPLDSLGEVHFFFGRFEDAGRYFLQAFDRNPTFLGGATLWKAAFARLFRGDVTGAGKLYEQYAGLRRAAGDPLTYYHSAQWEYFTGHPDQAALHLEQFAPRSGTPPDSASVSWAQLSVWALETGQPDRAREYAAKALSSAQSEGTRHLATVCRFLADTPVSASEWALRAERSFPEPSQEVAKRIALAYALVFSKQFAEAALQFRDLMHQVHPLTDSEIRLLLAWSLMESGKPDDARDLLALWPIPAHGSDSPFQCLIFPRVLYLHGLLLQQENKRQEGQALLDLFRKYSGNTSTIWEIRS